MRLLENARGKLSAVGVIRNAIVRDEGLRRKTEAYWRKEGEITGQIMAEREVIEGVRSALDGRIQVVNLEAEATKYAEGITSWDPIPQVGQNGRVASK